MRFKESFRRVLFATSALNFFLETQLTETAAIRKKASQVFFINGSYLNGLSKVLCNITKTNKN
jgi:hypothetical protein